SPLICGDAHENAAELLGRRIEEHTQRAPGVAVGRYGEARLLYTSPLFAAGDADPGECRTVHLGLDLFAPPGTGVRAPVGGVVHALADNAAPQDYGPVIVLRHESVTAGSFYTLYGHLSRESLQTVRPGQIVEAGQQFAEIGRADVNGGWTPHVHFQLIVDLL